MKTTNFTIKQKETIESLTVFDTIRFCKNDIQDRGHVPQNLLQFENHLDLQLLETSQSNYRRKSRFTDIQALQVIEVEREVQLMKEIGPMRGG